MGTESGEDRQLLRAHEHVDRVDLDQADAVEHAAQVPAVDAALRPGIGQPLRGEADAPGLGERERERRRHRRRAVSRLR